MPASSALASRTPVDFSFESLDERPVNALATRGAPTVLAFVTTASLPAQAQVDFLVAMARHDSDRVHYAVVALEDKDSRELVELYRKALSIPFPVAMADSRTLAGKGDFGDVSGVPVTVVLDRHGRLVSRVDGRVAKSAELRAAMRGL
ncbi:MAG: TlpA family protein disulfide reductase [Myxococcota bacterium]|nr:TlpA family protein disulfide reductase [Myxococcota bacterium]